MDDDELRGRPLAEDEDREPGAFLRRPPDAPVYYGFPILDESEVDGFRYGAITDFEAEPDDAGDTFVLRPPAVRTSEIRWYSALDDAWAAPGQSPEEEATRRAARAYRDVLRELGEALSEALGVPFVRDSPEDVHRREAQYWHQEMDRLEREFGHRERRRRGESERAWRTRDRERQEQIQHDGPGHMMGDIFGKMRFGNLTRSHETYASRRPFPARRV